MKNNTFDQIINSDLASIDPGFGQFALAKASADLMKKVLNMREMSKDKTDEQNPSQAQGNTFYSELT